MIQFNHTPTRNSKGKIINNDDYTIIGDDLDELIEFTLTKVKRQSREFKRTQLLEDLPEKKRSFIDPNAGMQYTYTVLYKPHLKGVIPYQKCIDDLREKLIKDIRYLLTSNNLKELNIDENLADLTYVYWSDRKGSSHNGFIQRVYTTNEGIGVYVEDKNDEGGYNLSSKWDEGFQNLDCLENLRKNIVQTLSNKKYYED